MTEINPLDALEALHRELVAVIEHRFESLHVLELQLDAHAQAFKKLLDKPAKNEGSRNTIKTGKLAVENEQYTLNAAFQENAFQLADEVDLDEIEAAKILLNCQDDPRALGRTLFESGLVWFHQQRRYLLDCMRLCIQIAGDDDLDDNLQQFFRTYVDDNVYGASAPGGSKIIPRCMDAMQGVKSWLQKIADKVTAAGVFHGTDRPPLDDVLEYSRLSLLQQHEVLALITAGAIEKRHSKPEDFKTLLKTLQKLDRYDHLLIHLFPIIGSYITVFGSYEGNNDIEQAREFHRLLTKTDDESWVMPYLHAAIRAWWILEYAGLFVDVADGLDSLAASILTLILDEKTRAKQFTEALKDGAFDFVLSLAADVKTPIWHDPTRLGIRQWLQRKSPSLMDAAPFSEEFQLALVMQLENLVEGLISNMPDVLRKMRNEEDEQRQLNAHHEQDLDLERFLLIIAYAYEGRPDAAEAFWADPDSNLAGFLQWSSRRASTPLVSAFCEMLQSISDDDNCASSAHAFLLDEGQTASGKLRKSHSLTWTQIFKELTYFTNKLQKPATSQSHIYRSGKPTPEQAEAEPESAMMLECYLRLITKLASQSEAARIYLLKGDYNLVVGLYQLIIVPGLHHARLRSSAFYAMRALMIRKSQEECSVMWSVLDSWATGQMVPLQVQSRQTAASVKQTPMIIMRDKLQELSKGFEEPNSVVQFLNSLVSPVVGSSPLSDVLPFPEELGSQTRMPGIDPYVDYILDDVLGKNSRSLQDPLQMRTLRLSCFEFVLLCLDNFNEDLILLGHETNIPVDSIIATTDLSSYVRLHPFARVMELMLNRGVIEALFDTVSPNRAEELTQIASATPDSPIILSILRAVEVITKVLEMQDTYADLIRPLIQGQPNKKPLPAPAYLSFEDAIMSRIGLVVDLGRYCGMGHPALTLACLKLLERISSSPKIASAWGPGQYGQTHRNKAIVALEKMGDSDVISASLIGDLTEPLDFSRKADSPNYLIKIYILDFLFACLRATPNQPSIAHQLLGFECGIDFISAKKNSAFDRGTSLFHQMLRVLIEVPFGDDESGIWRWTVDLKFKIMRILQVLWTAPLSSSIVLSELRNNDFIFHLLLREINIQAVLPWDGQLMAGPEFLLTEASIAFISFLALRSLTLEYASIELCSISQQRQPHLKRKLLGALNGQFKDDDGELTPVLGVFDLFDFLASEDQLWNLPTPAFDFYRDLDLAPYLQIDSSGNTLYNLDRVKEVLLLKRLEFGKSSQLATEQDITAVDREELVLMEYIEFSNRQTQVASFRLKVLKSWTKLLLVMLESNEFKGSDQTSFLLQALQVILPSLDTYASEHHNEALELAKLAKVLLSKVDFTTAEDNSKVAWDSISDKLFQLFQICLSSISRWAGDSELRAFYYNICYRYLAGIVGHNKVFLASRQHAIKSIHIHGERLFNVLCDDAERGDANCQTAALILLGALVKIGIIQSDGFVVDTLNRLNFVGVLVDSLKSIWQDWSEAIQTGNSDIELLLGARLALIQLLCQTREGAKHVIQSNLFRAFEVSGLYMVDLDTDAGADNEVLEKLYSILLRATRVIGAAVLARGPQSNVTQGPARRFLTNSRTLIVQVLKKSAGIGLGSADVAPTRLLEETVDDLAEAFMVLISTTGFLEVRLSKFDLFYFALLR
ncbi:nucleoporin Nup186/Nup192/Nup205 [Coniella lustricola]|uniref:Nucleoporin Nup186/Nup192/Nup205 n=1 Tax=Coniella lustricola TaxID=2025994 RepID=A0A2T2ZVY8_9PEZI|nr:nucleoporin Nup186/Nup192/Nup205 [Coniella lustricola]